MTEEQTVKFYSAAFFAWREENGQPTIHIKPGIVIAFSEDEARGEGIGGAFAAFPEAENWAGHDVALTELPNDIDLGNYHVSWRADPRRT